MPSAEESAELRMLQAKAYGPDGGLTAAELERLRDLEVGLRLPSVAQPVSSPAAPQPPLNAPPLQGAPRAAAPSREERSPAPAAAERAEGVERAEGETKRVERAERVETAPAPRVRWAPLVAASVALVLGIGIGWLVFGRDMGPAIVVTAEQQVRGEQLAEESNLDPGSITPMAEDGDVLVWMGTRDEGEITCLIIDDGEHDAPSCGQTESLGETGVFGTLSRDAPSDSESDIETITASLVFAREDEPVVMIQRGWGTWNEGFLDQFTDPQQRATAERLLDEGLDEWSPTLAAHDGDTQIWIGTRDGGQQACLFYGAGEDAPSACGPNDGSTTTEVTVTPPHRVGEPPSDVSVTLLYNERMIPSIVISHDADPSALQTGPGSGDPIEVTPADPEG